MIFDPNTILVLGAGASSPYGLPLGQPLKQQIIRITQDINTTQSKQLLEAGFLEHQVVDFHTDLVRSIHPTIDAFLEDRPSRRDIGAFAIAQILMPLENEALFYPHKNWYPILFKELDFRDNQHPPTVTAVITFNYDRSLEHYLTETINRTYEGDAKAKALEKLECLRIIHVHGQLGPYPKVPYVEQRAVEDIKNGAKGISMIHDNQLDQSKEFQEASELITTASDVIFLGFGYDPRSLKRLSVLRAVKGPKFHGTAHGLPDEWQAEVKRMFEDRIQLNHNNYTIEAYLPHFHRQKMRERQERAQHQNLPDENKARGV